MRYRVPILLTALALVAGVCWSLMRRGPEGTAADPAPIASVGAPAGPGRTTQPIVPQPLANSSPALLAEAVRVAEGRRSVTARIRQRAELFGQPVIGSGSYAELRGGETPLIRLELQTQSGEEWASLVQVCDGQTFWTYEKLPRGESVSQIDVRRAMAALKQAEGQPKPGGGLLPGLGGIPRLLRGLHRAMEFQTAQCGTMAGMAVWRIEGSWRRGHLAAMLPKQQAAIERGEPIDLRGLPPHVPDRVVILLGQEDLFPYRIDYCRTESAPRAGSRTLLTIEYFEVSLDRGVTARHFSYSPGQLEATDQTEAFLQSLSSGL